MSNDKVAPAQSVGVPRLSAVQSAPPTVPAQVNGRLKVASANLLNFFNTFTLCSNGLGGTPEGNNAARADGWPKMLAFLDQAFAGKSCGVN